MTFTIKTNSGIFNITTIEREIAHNVNPEIRIRQCGLAVQAPWQSGMSVEWYDSEEARDDAEAVAAASIRMR